MSEEKEMPIWLQLLAWPFVLLALAVMLGVYAVIFLVEWLFGE